VSQRLRKKFRGEKKEFKALKEASRLIQDKNSLSIEVLPETEEDVETAKSITFQNSKLSCSCID
jgi:hypothetical protein